MSLDWRRLSGIATCAAAFVFMPLSAETEQPFCGKAYWKFNTSRVKDHPGAVKITTIQPAATGEGILQIGDVIIGADGKSFDGESWTLSKAGEWLPPGTVISLQILRDSGNGAPPQELTVEVPVAIYPGTTREIYQAPELASVIASDEALEKQVLERLSTAEGDQVANYHDLRYRLRNIDSFTDGERLPLFRMVLDDPFRAENLTKYLAEQKIHDLAAVQALLKGEKEGVQIPRFYPAKDISWEALLTEVQQILQQAAQAQAEAVKDLTAEEIAFIRQHLWELLDTFEKCHMLSYEPDQDRLRRIIKVLDLLKKSNTDRFFKQAAILSRLDTIEFRNAIRRLAPEHLGRIETPYGAIVVAGHGNDIHEQDAALILDLGGDDLYFNNLASATATIPSALILDFAGNDVYESYEPYTLACGMLGAGILLDDGGQDNYVVSRYGLAAGFGGIGMLADRGGEDDVYRGLTFSQGVGLFGAGVLLDAGGNERYESLQVSQGVGFTRGIGILHDAAGQDNYYCKGLQPSNYGSRGHFEGWGQGAGCGFRPYASGGIGLLYDFGNGNDVFEGGNFVQGGGYFYGLGGLFDEGGNDKYIATRYGQAFSAHQAVGLFQDKQGNDVYRTRSGVAPGLAWDECVSCFLEEGGNDDYPANGFFAFGATANNAICFFVEQDGVDQYPIHTIGESSYNAYHGGTSLTLFRELGSDEDVYAASNQRKNNSLILDGQMTIFEDR